MSTEFGFHIIDANQQVEPQQALLRQLVADKLDLDSFLKSF